MALNEYLPWTATGDTKPNEFKIYLNAAQGRQSTPSTAERANLIQGTTERNQWFDLSPVYVNVDENCPWTNGYIVDKWDTEPYAQEYNNEAVSIFPMLCNTLADGQSFGIARAGSSNYTSGTGDTAKYYQLQSWFNAEAKNRTTSNVKIVHGQVGNGNPVTKLGGQALIAIPFIRAHASETGGAGVFANMDSYFNTDSWNKYQYISYIGVRLYTFNTTKASNKNYHVPTTVPYGGGYVSSYQYPAMTMLPLLKNESLRLKKNYEDTELSQVEMSIFDMYNIQGNSNTNDNTIPLFGALHGITSSFNTSTITTHYLCVDKLSYAYRLSGSSYYFKAVNRSVFGSTKEEIQEAIRRRVAYLGLFFAESESFVFNTSGNEWNTYEELFTDERMFCGTIDDSGTTHGNYTHGKKNYGAKQFGSGDLSKDTNVKPITPGGGSKGPTSGGDKDREKSTYSGSGFDIYNKTYSALGLRRYIITEAQFENLYTYLDQCLNYDASLDRFASNLQTKVPGVSPDDTIKIWKDRFPTEADYLAHVTNKLGYGNDPRNNIVSVMLYPCKVTEGTQRKIRLGQYIEGHKFEVNVPVGSGTTEWIQFAPNANYAADDVHEPSFDIDTLYGTAITVKHPNDWDDFRAYEPYSRCELYIPYHGIIPINLADCLGKSLSIAIQFDTITGSSVAVVRVNGQIYSTIPGQIGFNMPFSVDASSMTATGLMGLSAQSQANKLQATGNVIGGVLGAAGGIMSGNYLGAAGAVTNAIIGSKQNQIQEKAIEYSINHACDGRLVSNAASAIANMGLEKKAKLIWHYPLMLAYNDKNYAHTVGYATTRSGSVGSFSGYTVFTNADLANVSATEQEKAMILAQLQNGIII